MIPLYDIRLEPDSIQQAVSVLESGNLKQGEWTERFEQAFADRFEASRAIAVSSGTAALHLAVQALFEPGDEILVPDFTFFATASSVALAGCSPVFCDVREDTFTLDPRDAANRLSDRTRGLILVHLFGHPAPVDEMEAFAKQHNLKIIHDLAQSHGIRWDDREMGGRGEASCYSFYPTKNLPAGEGGMITTNDPVLAEKVSLLRNHGMKKPYQHTLLGYNYRMTDVEGAVGLGQLRAFDKHLAKRLDHDRRLKEELKEENELTWQATPPSGRSAPNLLTGRVRNGRRDAFVLKLKEQGVGCGVYYPSPLHVQECFRSFPVDRPCPVSERLCGEVFSLPVHPFLSPEDVKTIVAAVRRALHS